MKATIIVPVYNVEKYIEDCLDSIYDGNLNDFEVIIIDDKGTDKSIEIIRKYIENKKISNLIIVEHEENKGLSAARNTGIRIAKGDYIVFLDSDDMINSKNLDYIIDYAKKNNLDIVEGDIEEILETEINIKSKDGISNRNDSKILSGDDYFFESSKKGEYIPMVWSRIYKREYLNKENLFVTGLKFEDEEFSPRIIINANRIQYINKKTYVYRRRDNSITTAMVKDTKWIEHYLIIIKKLLEFSEIIHNKKSYIPLMERIQNLSLSIIKNPIAYGATEESLKNTIKIIKENKIYRIPQKSKNIVIKIQGYLMRYPQIFIKIYHTRLKK